MAITVPFAPRHCVERAEVSIQRLGYRYPGAASEALRGISLTIPQGQYVALLGHNGSGKSTLSRLIGGLIAPSSGSVTVAGLDTSASANRPRIRELVGMIFSDPDNQIIATIVEDDVGWGLAARGFSRELIHQRVGEALDAVRMTEHRLRAPQELSGGQRQRLAIAETLALEPSILIADEPTAMLDPQSRVELTRLLRALNRERGLTVIHVTHLLEEAAAADRVVALNGGQIALDEPPSVAFTDLDRLRALRLVIPDTALLIERLRAVGLAIPADALDPDQLADALAEAWRNSNITWSSDWEKTP